MSTDERNVGSAEAQTPLVSPGNYSPVTVDNHDTVGAIFLGILAIISLIGWMRAEARYRALISRSGPAEGNHWPDGQ